jgi:hypothetical protein
VIVGTHTHRVRSACRFYATDFYDSQDIDFIGVVCRRITYLCATEQRDVQYRLCGGGLGCLKAHTGILGLPAHDQHSGSCEREGAQIRMCTVVLVLLNRLRRPYRLGHLVWVTPPFYIHATDNARHRFVISAFSATMASSSVEHSAVSRRWASPTSALVHQ